ncbi:MAG: peptidase M20, partial [Ornithinimicrobium sp.]
LMAEYPTAYCLAVGTIRAGDWSSSVPDLLVAEGRFGVALGEKLIDAQAEFEHCVASACHNDAWLRDHPAVISWTGGEFGSGRLPAGHPLGDLVRDSHAAVTDSALLRERGAPYGSDLRLYTSVGVPTLHYGPGDVRDAHSPREQVRISDILTVTQTLTVAAMRAVGPRSG